MASPSGGDGDSELILHRWPSAWGLPSLSPECVAVEAYLRLAGLRFACEDCKTPYASPSGQLPALDQCADIVGEDAGAKDAAARDHTGALAARRIADHLAKKVANLDAHLGSATDRAHLAAYLALVESKLATATAHYTWIDRDRFTAHTREAYGQAFPQPLSYIIPWLWRRRAAKRLGAPLGGEVSDAAVRAGAADAYAALSVFLRDRGGDQFMFGKKPTSLDAVAFAHLSFHALAPVGDALRDELKKHPNLVNYVERVRRVTFPDASGNGGTGGSAMDAIDSSKWLDPPDRTGSGRRRGWWGYGGDASRGGWSDGKKEPLKKKPRSAKDIRFRRRSRWSVAIAIAAVASYLLTGELITFVFSEEGEGDREVNEGAAEEVEDAEEEVELEEPLDDDDAEEPPPEAEEE
jgi:metaxin